MSLLKTFTYNAFRNEIYELNRWKFHKIFFYEKKLKILKLMTRFDSSRTVESASFNFRVRVESKS